jgi:hypothetical protein
LKYKLLFILLLFIFIPLSSAVFELPAVKKNTCAELVQTCANCTFVNVTSVKLPNQTILSFNRAMSQNSNVYNYTFCNTTLIGNYIYDTIGNPDGTLTTASVLFEVTETGDVISTAQSIIYLIGILLGSGIFVLFITLALKINFDNFRNNDGFIEKINFGKYLRILFIALSYITFVLISFFMWNLSLGYNSSVLNISSFFWFIHRLSFVFLVPVSVAIILFSVITFIRDAVIKIKLSEFLKIK